MARINLLESSEDSTVVGNDSMVRLKELKAAVYVNAASVQVITQDTKDFMDRPDTD
jgi:transcriptional regulator NrdR family protein